MLNMTTLSPFPGMDPYLEQYWGDVHHGYARTRGISFGVVYLRDLLHAWRNARLLKTSWKSTCAVIPDVRVVERTAGRVALAPGVCCSDH